MPLHGKVVVIKRSGPDGAEFPLTSNSCLLGRHIDCDIRIQIPHISSQHARLDVNQDGEIYITNLSQSNTTTLNKSVVRQTTRINHMDTFSIADRSFRLEYPPGSQHRNVNRLSSPPVKMTATTLPQRISLTGSPSSPSKRDPLRVLNTDLFYSNSAKKTSAKTPLKSSKMTPLKSPLAVFGTPKTPVGSLFIDSPVTIFTSQKTPAKSPGVAIARKTPIGNPPIITSKKTPAKSPVSIASLKKTPAKSPVSITSLKKTPARSPVSVVSKKTPTRSPVSIGSIKKTPARSPVGSPKKAPARSPVAIVSSKKTPAKSHVAIFSSKKTPSRSPLTVSAKKTPAKSSALMQSRKTPIGNPPLRRSTVVTSPKLITPKSPIASSPKKTPIKNPVASSPKKAKVSSRKTPAGNPPSRRSVTISSSKKTTRSPTAKSLKKTPVMKLAFTSIADGQLSPESGAVKAGKRKSPNSKAMPPSKRRRVAGPQFGPKQSKQGNTPAKRDSFADRRATLPPNLTFSSPIIKTKSSGKSTTYSTRRKTATPQTLDLRVSSPKESTAYSRKHNLISETSYTGVLDMPTTPEVRFTPANKALLQMSATSLTLDKAVAFRAIHGKLATPRLPPPSATKSQGSGQRKTPVASKAVSQQSPVKMLEFEGDSEIAVGKKKGQKSAVRKLPKKTVKGKKGKPIAKKLVAKAVKGKVVRPIKKTVKKKTVTKVVLLTSSDMTINPVLTTPLAATYSLPGSATKTPKSSKKTLKLATPRSTKKTPKGATPQKSPSKSKTRSPVPATPETVSPFTSTKKTPPSARKTPRTATPQKSPPRSVKKTPKVVTPQKSSPKSNTKASLLATPETILAPQFTSTKKTPKAATPKVSTPRSAKKTPKAATPKVSTPRSAKKTPRLSTPRTTTISPQRSPKKKKVPTATLR